MHRIKRTKGERTHYATVVHPNGVIGGWSEDAEKAVAVTDAVAQRVRDYHAHRPNVGTLAFEKVDVSAAELATAVAAEDGVRAQEFAKLQGECKRLQEENAALRKAAKEASTAAEAAERKEQASVQRALDLEHVLTEKGQQVAALSNRIAELEKPKEPAKQESPKAPEKQETKPKK